MTTASPSAAWAAGADVAIGTSWRELRRAESIVTALVEAGAHSHAALYAQAAMHRAAYRHAGVFASAAIEAELCRSAACLRIAEVSPRLERASPDPRRVLHVATEVPSPEGGHTRLIERWVRSDSARAHSLALTSPRAAAGPPLAAAIAAAGGAVHHLSPGSASFWDRARELRQLADGFEAIVLHCHPYDALPLLALAWPGRPPTVLANHSGHLPWIGRPVADVVACGRPAALELCTQRRGLLPQACHLLPLAVERAWGDAGERQRRREHARAELGLDDDHLVLLTIASEYKLRQLGDRDHALDVDAVLRETAAPRWLLAGPRAEGRWLELESGGRTRCLGVRDDVGSLYAAADVYLDSYPFSSQTSMLDAAANGLPVLARRGHPPAARILSAWGGQLDAAILGFADDDSLRARLCELADPRLRARRTERSSAAVAALSTGAAWATLLPPIYELAAERRCLADPQGLHFIRTSPPAARDDLDRYLSALHGGGEPPRGFFNWQREITNTGAVDAFPAEEAWLAGGDGMAGLAGELELIVRDFEARCAELEQAVKQKAGIAVAATMDATAPEPAEIHEGQ